MKSVGRRTGRAELDEHAEGVHVSELEVDLKPSSRPKTEIVADIRARLGVLPLSVNVGQPISHRLDHMLSGIRSEIALKIFGDDLDTMRNTAEESARQACRDSRPRPTCRSRSRCRIPQLEIRVDYARAALYGVQPAAVVDQFSRLSNGRVVSRVVDGYRRFDVVMRLPESLRTTQGLGDLLIETPSGWIPARQVAEIKETNGPNQILRENGRRRLVVLANSDGKADMAKLVEQIRGVIARDQAAGGHFRQPRRHVPGAGTGGAHHRPAVAGVAAADLRDPLQPLPLGGAGADHHRQRAAGADRLGRGALAGRSAAVGREHDRLHHADRHRGAQRHPEDQPHHQSVDLHEGMPWGRELVTRGCLERMTPVLMTALAAGVALVPLLIDAASPGKEILHPVAVTIFGGLISATLLDAFVTPLLVLAFGRRGSSGCDTQPNPKPKPR